MTTPRQKPADALWAQTLACRACNSDSLKECLDLGAPCLPTPVPPGGVYPPQVPLSVLRCRGCGLVQLSVTPSRELLWRHGWDRASATTLGEERALDVKIAAARLAALAGGDHVLDIGSGDSALLRHWRPDLVRVGFEPGRSLMHDATFNGAGLQVVNDFFDALRYRAEFPQPAKIITACDVLDCVDTPGEFLADLRSVLHADGVLVLETRYLPLALVARDVTAFRHGRLCYYSLSSLVPLLGLAGLYPFDAETNTAHGGSLRLSCAAGPRRESRRLQDLLRSEDGFALKDALTWALFARAAEETRAAVRDVAQHWERPAYAVGLSAGGMTALQVWGLGPDCLDGVMECDDRKAGLVAPGCGLKVFLTRRVEHHAKTALLLPWHLRDDFLRREQRWARHCNVVVPLPHFHSVGGRR